MEAGEPPTQAQPVSVSDLGLSTDVLKDFFGDLYRQAGAEKFGLSLEDFASMLREVTAKYRTAATASGSDSRASWWVETSQFCASLHLEELALARACAKGSEPAWEVFLTRYREKLYDAARSIAQEESQGRELADSLYADLFGLNKGGAPRVSKLSYYTGRGSLEGWLRTVLAHEYVNRYRSQRRLVSLEEQEEAGAQFRAADSDPAPPVDARLEVATDEALEALPAEDRFILASYFLDGRTLAETARILGVHESTVSRRVEKITAALRKQIVSGLMRRGMSREQAREALEADVRDLSLDVTARLREGIAQDKDG